MPRRASALLLLCLVLAGCARGLPPGQVTLTIWSSPTGIEERAFQKLCARFEREHPNITLHNVGALNEEKLIRAIVAGAPPDLAYIYGVALVGPLAANHAVEPLDERFRRAGFREEGFALRYLHINGAWEDHRILARTVEDGPVQ